MDALGSIALAVVAFVLVGAVGFGAHALMRRRPALGRWRYRLRRRLHLREDTTDLVVKHALGLGDSPGIS